MTAKSRRAIVEYWLFKRWMDLGPEALRRLSAHSFFLMSLFVCILLMAPSASAEVKAIQTKPVEQKSAVKSQAVSAVKSAVKTEKKKDEKVVEKTVKGIVSFIRKNKMAVELAENEQGGQEILLGIAKDVKFKKAKAITDIAQGDTVAVKYLETFLDPKVKGGETTVLSMVVSEISLVSKAKPLPGAALEAKGKLLE